MFGLLDLDNGEKAGFTLVAIAVALRDLSHDTQHSFVTSCPPSYK